jgi:broad specificity phosphatase PhoE
MSVKIVFVRHGETEWNRDERYRGRIDVPLNPTGEWQAKVTARFICENWQPAAVYSSPLSRALATAQAIAEASGLNVQESPGLIDTNYGLWQSLTPAEAARRWPDLSARWHSAPHTVTLPSGEALAEVQARAMAAVTEITKRHDDETIVMVSHTDVIRLLLMGMLGMDIERFRHLRQDNCAISLVEESGGDFTMIIMNNTFHLHTNT